MFKIRSVVSGAAAVAALAPLLAGTAVLVSAGAAQAVSRPVISMLSPNAGPVEGYNTIIITGTGFTPGSRVKFGKKWATHVTARSSTKLAVISPHSQRIKVVHVWVFSRGRHSNPLQFTYSTAQIDENCFPGTKVAPSLILWVAPHHKARMYSKTTHVWTAAVMTDQIPQDRRWHFGTETGLKNHKRYSVTVYLDGRRHVVHPFTMGRKCGFTIWRGRSLRHRHH